MINLLMYIALFVFSFYIITKAADYFIDEAAKIGKDFGMSKLLIGLTIVAIGTSLPEMITSLGAILFTTNYPDFIIGTTLGSNITNILLAFGVFLIVSNHFETTKRELFNVLSLIFTTIVFTTFILLGFVNYFAILLVIFYTFYIIYLSKFQKKEVEELHDEFVEEEKHSRSKSIGIIIIAFFGLYFGSKIAITSIENIGLILKIPIAYLTLTTISVATSLPEIAVTISSAKKKEYLLGIGNILGTNVINVCMIIGISGFFGHYPIDTAQYLFSIILFLIATLSFSYMIVRRSFNKYFGYFYLFLYIIYIGNLLIKEVLI